MKIINNISQLEEHLKSKGSDLATIEAQDLIQKSERNCKEGSLRNDSSRNNLLKNNSLRNDSFKNDSLKRNSFGNDLEHLKELDKCKTRLLKYIVYKKRTKAEIRTKFAKDFDENVLDNAIFELEEKGYINDENYIERAVNEFIAIKTLSINEIKYKLKAKGLTSSQIDNYVQNHYEELIEYEKKSAKKIATKYQNLEQIKLIAYLKKKGYKSESIKQALEVL